MAVRRLIAPVVRPKKYGWTPDLPDQRDYKFSAVYKIPAKLPASVDLRAQCSPVEDQGNLGSCTANALAGALEFLERKDQVAFVDLSRLFIYYNERVIEHTVELRFRRDAARRHQDAGQAGRVHRSNVAVCHCPKFTNETDAACYKEAAYHQITSYQRLLTVDEMRSCLADGYPFVFGFTVYESFESATVARTGTVNMPKPGEKVLGGHAVMAVGYDDNRSASSSAIPGEPAGGKQGYFTMPYAYLDDRDLSDDFWTIRRGQLL